MPSETFKYVHTNTQFFFNIWENFHISVPPKMEWNIFRGAIKKLSDACHYIFCIFFPTSFCNTQSCLQDDLIGNLLLFGSGSQHLHNVSYWMWNSSLESSKETIYVNDVYMAFHQYFGSDVIFCVQLIAQVWRHASHMQHEDGTSIDFMRHLYQSTCEMPYKFQNLCTCCQNYSFRILHPKSMKFHYFHL